MRLSALPTLLIALLLVAIAPAPQALPYDHPVIDAAPPDARLAIAIRDASKLRHEPAVKLIRRILPLVADGFDGRLPWETRPEDAEKTSADLAWDKVAQAMDVPPDQAFDRVLGKRVLFTLDELGPGAGWCLSTDIATADAKSLLKAFDAAPRRTHEGTPILAIEQGRVLLALTRSPWEKDRALLLIAPGGSDASLESSIESVIALNDRGNLGVIDDPGAVMTVAHPVGAMREHAHTPRLSMLLREGGDEVRATADVDDRGWELSIRAPHGRAGVLLGSPPAIDPQLFERFAEGSCFAIAGSAPASSLLPQDIEAVLPDRLRAVFATVAPSATMISVVAPQPGTPGFRVLVAARHPADQVAAADELDDAIATLSDADSFAGFRPDATRRCELRPTPIAAAAKLLLGGPPSIAWTYRPADQHALDADPATWWIASIGAGKVHAGSLPSAAERLLEPPRPGPPVHAAGRIDPAPLFAALLGLTGDSGPVTGLEALGEIDAVHWSTEVRRGQAIVTARIDLAPPD